MAVERLVITVREPPPKARRGFVNSVLPTPYIPVYVPKAPRKQIEEEEEWPVQHKYNVISDLTTPVIPVYTPPGKRVRSEEDEEWATARRVKVPIPFVAPAAPTYVPIRLRRLIPDDPQFTIRCQYFLTPFLTPAQSWNPQLRRPAQWEPEEDAYVARRAISEAQPPVVPNTSWNPQPEGKVPIIEDEEWTPTKQRRLPQVVVPPVTTWNPQSRKSVPFDDVDEFVPNRRFNLPITTTPPATFVWHRHIKRKIELWQEEYEMIAHAAHLCDYSVPSVSTPPTPDAIWVAQAWATIWRV